MVVTFDRHPATVVRPESAPKLLCDLDQKLELLEAAGVDRTVVVHFDEERANETAEDFVEVMLVEGLDARLVVVGEDFHFGHGRKGNVALLREMGSTAGFAVEGVLSGGRPRPQRVRPRAHLVDPDPQPGGRRPGGGGGRAAGPTPPGPGHRWSTATGGAAPSLGSPRPTSTCPRASACRRAGIYAGWYERPDGSVHPAAVSVGRRPTFYGDDGDLLVEAFLLDFSGDLYGEQARVSFVAHLRDEVAFDSVDEPHRPDGGRTWWPPGSGWAYPGS